MVIQPEEAAARAAALDAADPLAAFADRFEPPGADVVAYFDGNSLGRPVRGVADRMAEFVRQEWGGRLIRGWTDGWLGRPEVLGDRLGRVALGAAPGQVVVADSTSVLLYKLARAAVDARPDRTEIVLDAGDFPTDRYVLEGIATERGLQLRWLDTDPDAGVTVQQVADAVGSSTALVALSHIAYRSAWVVDAAAVTEVAHAAGALVLWDLSHSVGLTHVRLDGWGADLAVGCGYKYLNGGPGAPAFGYLRRGLQGELRQPVQGWIGRRDPFVMGPGYDPADGVRSLLSGTPPILAMVPLACALDLLEESGVDAVRAKSHELTAFALELVDAWLVPLGVEVASPRDPERRGGHLMIRRPGLREVVDRAWQRGVIPDYREPDGIRIGLAPLSTTFGEVCRGMAVLRELAGDGG
jgi:kynureninase